MREGERVRVRERGGEGKRRRGGEGGLTVLSPPEVTQEVAARGMGLTYELCDSSTKQEMVQSLVGTLMEGRK